VKLLAIETASDACSCALLNGDNAIQRHQMAPRRHAELVLSMVEEVLVEAGLQLTSLDALAFGRGPGSFTGVRIAASVVQGLAYGAGLPVVAVSSLQALAQGAWREGSNRRVLAAFDARMGEVYWGAYEVGEQGLMMSRGADIASSPRAVPLPEGDGWLGAGEGWGAHGAALRARLGDKLAGSEPHRVATAMDVACLAGAAFARGESVDASQALPVYVRNEVARKRGA
jgi:tRNA threonylcarbamoyladenosine biosynthesis protein TsaB